MNFVITSANFHEFKVDFYIKVFGWSLPATFLISPLLGWIVDKSGSVGAIVVVQLFGLLFCGLKMVPVVWVQVASFFILSTYRAIFYTAVLAFLIQV